LLASTTWAGKVWQLTIVHTNDLHGRMLPFAYTGASVFCGKNVGGLARRATAINTIRKSTTHPVVVVDSGDLFTRGPWQHKFYGMPEIDALNAMSYDVLCIGNGEFQAKAGTDAQEIMLGLVRRSCFPWLAANLTVTASDEPVEGILPYIVLKEHGVRVGFLGLTAPRATAYAQVKRWTISDPLRAAKLWVPRVRKECDILIAVTHIGFTLDKQLAAQVPGIDAIVGGDSHTFLTKPLLVKNPLGRKVPIVQAGEYGVCLGRLDLTFTEKAGKWLLCAERGQLLPINQKSYAAEPTVQAILDHLLKNDRTSANDRPVPGDPWQKAKEFLRGPR
jgi:2',3'-cyclic-nucleotide 2'-phosphodiesterase (5'-nucleotidase family)